MNRTLSLYKDLTEKKKMYIYDDLKGFPYIYIYKNIFCHCLCNVCKTNMYVSVSQPVSST